MRDEWLLMAALLAGWAGMAWLALAMNAHWSRVRGDVPLGRARARRLRMLGIAALAASLALCFQADHASMAVLVWVMNLAGSALGVATLLAWRPRWLRGIAALCP